MVSGVRDRKKRELRDELSLTTVLLARECGLANVRVADIVERVGVSRRTFTNYFASKEDAIADRHVQRTREAAEALRERPADEPLWDALTAVIVEPYAGWSGATSVRPKDEQDSLIAVLSMPDMQTAVARGSFVANEVLAEAIADRLGTDETRDIYPRLAANAALTTQLVTLDYWLHAEPAAQLLPLMRESFHRLGAGLDAPPAADQPSITRKEGNQDV